MFLLASSLQAAAAPAGTADPDHGATSSGAGRGGEGTRGGSLPGTPPLARAPPPRDSSGFRFKILFFLLRFFAAPPLCLPPRIESDPGPGVPDAERTAGGAVSGTGRAESWVAGAENRGSRPADSRARAVQCSIRSAPHPQEVPEVLGRPEGAVSDAGGGGIGVPPGSEVGGRGLGTEALLGRPFLLRRSARVSCAVLGSTGVSGWPALGAELGTRLRSTRR